MKEGNPCARVTPAIGLTLALPLVPEAVSCVRWLSVAEILQGCPQANTSVNNWPKLQTVYEKSLALGYNSSGLCCEGATLTPCKQDLRCISYYLTGVYFQISHPNQVWISCCQWTQGCSNSKGDHGANCWLRFPAEVSYLLSLRVVLFAIITVEPPLSGHLSRGNPLLSGR